MGDFSKKEYDKQYNKNHRSMIRVNVSNEEKAAFEKYCSEIGVVPSTYLKRLINEDAVRRGMEPLFRGCRPANEAR